MKKKLLLLVTALLLLIPGTTQAQEIGKDKYMHAGVCAAAEAGLSQVKPFSKWKPWQRAAFTTVVIGGGKELYDARHSGHSASWADLGADAVGAFGAEGVIWVVHKTF